MKTKVKVKVVVFVELESDLPVQDTIDVFTSDCDYSFKSTAHVKVLDTDWRDTIKMSSQETISPVVEKY